MIPSVLAARFRDSLIEYMDASYPITTPAHGTAFGRAGQGRASNHAFKNALKVLVRMAENR